MDAPHDWALRHAQERPEAPAVDAASGRLTYAGLARRMLDLGRRLVHMGLRRRERVLVALPSTPAAVVVGLAVQLVGACAAEISPRAGEGALRDAAQQLDARIAVLPGGSAPPPGVEQVLAVGTDLGEDGALRDPCPGPDPRVPLDPDDEALILFTSGSTGRPRGVILTHRNLAANARSIAAYLQLAPHDRALLTLPLSYSYGRSVLHSHLLAGGSVWLENGFAFPAAALRAAARERCTSFSGVPAHHEMLRRLGLAPRWEGLRLVTQAGGPLAPETAHWLAGAAAPARLFLMYGQTEATARLAYVPPERLAEKLGSIGIPIPGVALTVEDARGRELPDGEEGELVARGENVAAGYLDAPEENRATFVNGALRTGDLARRDADGFFWLVGRAREFLKIAGNRVNPVEIEEVLGRHPEVVEVAVTGTPDPLEGEVPAALVVARAPGQALCAELQRFCRGALPAYKVPRRVVLVPRLPRSDAGKVLRRELPALLSRFALDDGAAAQGAVTSPSSGAAS